MPAEPDQKAEKDYQYWRTGDIKGLDKGFDPRPSITQRIETLHFASHDGDFFTIVQEIQDVQDEHGIRTSPLCP